MTPEGRIEKYLVDQVKAAGGFIAKVQWINRSNAPDRYASIPGYPGWTGFIEVKREGERATKAQAREHDRLRAAGTNVLVFNSMVNVDIFLDRVKHGQVIYKDIQAALKERETK